MTNKEDEAIVEEQNNVTPKKGRVWVLKHEGEGPFSSLNVGMAVISTQAACEGLGLKPQSKSYSQLVDEYHRGYK